jgi:hypothetical protein
VPGDMHWLFAVQCFAQKPVDVSQNWPALQFAPEVHFLRQYLVVLVLLALEQVCRKPMDGSWAQSVSVVHPAPSPPQIGCLLQELHPSGELALPLQCTELTRQLPDPEFLQSPPTSFSQLGRPPMPPFVTQVEPLGQHSADAGSPLVQ